jgi:hypothetical protein
MDCANAPAAPVVASPESQAGGLSTMPSPSSSHPLPGMSKLSGFGSQTPAAPSPPPSTPQNGHPASWLGLGLVVTPLSVLLFIMEPESGVPSSPNPLPLLLQPANTRSNSA